MRVESVGSSEAVLVLLADYQRVSGQRPDPYRLWEEIKAFIGSSQHGAKDLLPSYVASNHNENRPAAQYVSDLADLIDAGLLFPMKDGTVRLTEAGLATAHRRTLPSGLQVLAERVLTKARP